MKYESEAMNLYNQGIYSGAEISRISGIPRNRVWDALKKNGISGKNLDELNRFVVSSKLQEEVLIGTVIGDGCLFHSKKTQEKYRLSLAHSLNQKEYFLKKYEILKPLIGSGYFIQNEFHKRAKKTYSCIKFQSRANLLYADLRSKWYRDNKKIICEDIYKYGADCLAVKFFDDGSDAKSGFNISMANFDDNSVKTFMDWMETNFGIGSNLHSNKNIYIPSKYREKFIETVKPFATSDVLYKLGELLETPEADNQQPSHKNTSESIVEGSTTNR